MTDLTDAELARLADWDTPTICNALEVVDPGFRMAGYTIRSFTCLRPGARPIVGHARTATLRATAPPDAEAVKLRPAYYQYIDGGGPKPSVVVIQDLDSHPGRGAFWGEVNTNIHKGLGAQGVVTNGSIRDLADSAEGFQALAGQVGPSHAWVHITGFGGEVEVHGLRVCHGDIVHADVHGAVVVPAEHVRVLPGVIEAIARKEAVVIAAARAPGFDFDKLKAAWGDAAEVH